MFARFFLICGLFFLVFEAMAAGAGNLRSHRAVYDLALARADAGVGIENLDGRLVHEWSRVCDGYIYSQSMVMLLSLAQGNDMTSRFDTSVWESTDGKRFRFFTENRINGQLDSGYEGEARKEGGELRVDFFGPEEKHRKWRVEAVFPSQFTADVVAAALQGKQFMQRFLFDGSTDKGAYRASVLFGKERTDLPDYAGDFALLKDERMWPAHIAYFPAEDAAPQNPEASGAGLPDMEISFDLYSNGIAGRMQIDYGEFSADVILKEIQDLDDPSC